MTDGGDARADVDAAVEDLDPTARATVARLRAMGHDRGAMVMVLLSQGLTQTEVAARLGISQGRVSEIKSRMVGAMPKTDLAELRAQLVAQLDRVRAKAEDIMHAPGAPVVKTVSEGEGGGSRLVVVRDPEHGDAIVRDQSASLAAMREVVRAQTREAALLGLDAPAKVEQSGAVRIEVVGVDVEDMT